MFRNLIDRIEGRMKSPRLVNSTVRFHLMSTRDIPRRALTVFALCLVLCGSLFGQTRRRLRASQADLVPTVDFCDLTVHPERYTGKLVRVSASLVSWWESSYLYNVRCETDEKKFITVLIVPTTMSVSVSERRSMDTTSS
jgi:hypothetical protein